MLFPCNSETVFDTWANDFFEHYSRKKIVKIDVRIFARTISQATIKLFQWAIQECLCTIAWKILRIKTSDEVRVKQNECSRPRLQAFGCHRGTRFYRPSVRVGVWRGVALPPRQGCSATRTRRTPKATRGLPVCDSEPCKVPFHRLHTWKCTMSESVVDARTNFNMLKPSAARRKRWN